MYVLCVITAVSQGLHVRSRAFLFFFPTPYSLSYEVRAEETSARTSRYSLHELLGIGLMQSEESTVNRDDT